MQNRIKNILDRNWFISLFALVFVSFLLFLPSDNAPEIKPLFPHFDKLVHLGLFAFLSFAIGFDFYAKKKKTPNRKNNFVLFLFLVAYAISSEIIQEYLVGRDGSIDDVLADILGIAIGLHVLNKYGVSMYKFMEKKLNT